ncbi:unnamed protein product, partial [Discosporangium mesarthrocarpum]
MTLATAAAACVSSAPNKLGVAAQFLDVPLVMEAGDVVRSFFIQRQADLLVECEEFTKGSGGNELGSPNAGSLARGATNLFSIRQTAADHAVALEEQKKSLRRVLDEETKTERPKQDALFTIWDAIAEAFIAGKGPFSPIGLYGLWYKLMIMVSRLGKLKPFRWLGPNYNPILTRYLKNGQRRDADKLSPPTDHVEALVEINDQEELFQHEFAEELRCIMHFNMLVLLSAEARLQREGILFRKFLRENHFKLLSNGIAPPKHIFKSNSFASVNIRMVAVWLAGLSVEERERFQMLKSKFTDLQTERDSEIAAADAKSLEGAIALEEARRPRVTSMVDKQREMFMQRREERANAWAETLSIQDAGIFKTVRDQWLKHENITVHPRNQPLREMFEERVLLNGKESIVNAQEILEDIDSVGRSCRPGTYGRKLQYVDPDFPPDNSSTGNVQSRQQLGQQWKVSLSVNPDMKLYDEGTDPDDVRQGLFADSWLLSAMSMIAAATVGDGGVDEQIAQLFINQVGGDGQPIMESYTGAYAVQLLQGGSWQVVIVDDYFPAVASNVDDDNKGLACAHSYGARELWVSLLEKAYAKFLGSYAALETGYVHLALKTLTGGDSEEIFLNGVGRGVGKKSLWKKMIKYRRNGYIMGAGTITGNLAEKQIQDIGLLFGAAYTILDVRESDGENLIKLCNPPGDHEEWQGDWGDHSSLWTRRSRKRLGVVEDTKDNTFWMSFNDFCIVFRSLYVCRWYDPRCWTTLQSSGSWEMGEDLDTAAGLPSVHQKVCELENNPQFHLEVHSPADVKISLVQTDQEVLPASCFIIKPDDGASPGRQERLTRENVVASSGQPVRERERHLYASLRPGRYVVMCAAYFAGMEGSFKASQVKVTTNSRQLRFNKLWPPADPAELGRVFDDTKMMGRLANLGLQKLEGVGAGMGDKLNEGADKLLEKTRGVQVG